MIEQEIVKMFCDLNRRGVNAEGIRVPNAVMSKAGAYTIAGIAMFGEEAGIDTYKAMARMLVIDRPDQLIFGIDRFVKPGQGETDDALSVHFWDGQLWHFGIIPYRFDPPFFGDIDWQNSFWCGSQGALACEMRNTWKVIRAAPHRRSSPAMQLPLQTPQTMSVHG
jgi:hypothetical protein